MTLNTADIDAFRDAWLAAEGDDFASRASRRSLQAFAYGHAELEPVLFELTNRAQSELDLHIDGDVLTIATSRRAASDGTQ